jgi:hypothetical protein
VLLLEEVFHHLTVLHQVKLKLFQQLEVLQHKELFKVPFKTQSQEVQCQLVEVLVLQVQSNFQRLVKN